MLSNFRKWKQLPGNTKFGAFFQCCPMVVECYEVIILILNNFLKRQVNFNDLIHFSLNHRNKAKLSCALWFSVKIMFKIFNNKMFNKGQLLVDLIKELDWNLDFNRKIGFQSEMIALKNLLMKVQNWLSMDSFDGFPG